VGFATRLRRSGASSIWASPIWALQGGLRNEAVCGFAGFVGFAGIVVVCCDGVCGFAGIAGFAGLVVFLM
jgi:hypothetical protein